MTGSVLLNVHLCFPSYKPFVWWFQCLHTRPQFACGFLLSRRLLDTASIASPPIHPSLIPLQPLLLSIFPRSRLWGTMLCNGVGGTRCGTRCSTLSRPGSSRPRDCASLPRAQPCSYQEERGAEILVVGAAGVEAQNEEMLTGEDLAGDRLDGELAFMPRRAGANRVFSTEGCN